jgi:hypothetical protein
MILTSQSIRFQETTSQSVSFFAGVFRFWRKEVDDNLHVIINKPNFIPIVHRAQNKRITTINYFPIYSLKCSIQVAVINKTPFQKI